MDYEKKKSQSERFFGFLRNLFFVFLILQFAPLIISGMRTTVEEFVSPKTHVGYLSIEGPITDATFYIRKIREFLKSSDIKALLVRINSGGGYSGTCYAVFNEMKKFKAEKPVVAVIENAGASGAYYIALASNIIIANPMSLVGSIGTFMELPNVKELLSSWKVSYRYVQSGAYKTAGSAVKEISSEEIAYLQTLSDSQYKQFVKDVAENRLLAEENHTVWADGKAFTGLQAVDLKLIDKLGSLSDGLDDLKQILDTDREIKLVPAKKQQNILKMLSGNEDDYGNESMHLSKIIGTCMYQAYNVFISCISEGFSHR